MADNNDRFDKPKLELLEKVEHTLTRLNVIWEEIGISPDACRGREIVVFRHLMDLLDDMTREEDSMRLKLVKNLGLFKEEIQKLCAELGLPPYQLNETGKTRLELDRDLRLQLEVLSKQKNEKISQLEKLIDADVGLSRILGIPPFEIDPERVPSEEQLTELEERITDLEAEKKSRQSEFDEAREKLIDILEELESEPASAFEQEVIETSSSDFVLSDENMTSLRQFLSHVENRRRDHASKAKKLRKQLTEIWNCLGTSLDEQISFLNENSGIKPQMIQMMQEEVVRCRLLKIQNLRDIIETRRRDLAKLWDKCFFTDHQKVAFKPYFSEEFTEEVLEKFDQEIQRVEECYRQNQKVFDRVHDTIQLWNKFVEFERYTSDPSRFVNRGCYLLSEEKDRNKLIKELVKMEQEAAEEVELWEQKSGDQFLISGMRYPEYVEAHWDEYKAKKESEKQLRRAKYVSAEPMASTSHTTPSKTLTPSKSTPKLGSSTPTSTPSKSTPYMLTPTPNQRRRKIEMGTPGSMEPRPKALAEQNRNVVEGGDAEEKLFSQITVSTGEICRHDPDETIGPLEHYQDFAMSLNENYRFNSRSSVIPKSQDHK